MEADEGYPRGPRGRPGTSWAELVGIPAAFADGTDDVGYKSATQPTTYDLPANTTVYAFADVPPSVDVELQVIPAVGASLVAWELGMERGPRATSSYYGLPAVPADTVRTVYYVYSNDNAATTFKVRTRVYNTGIAPAAFKKAAKQVKVAVVKMSKRQAKEMRQRIGW